MSLPNTHNTIVFATFKGTQLFDPEGNASNIQNEAAFPFVNTSPSSISLQLSAREITEDCKIVYSTTGITGLGLALTAFNMPEYIYQDQDFYFTAKITDAFNAPIKNTTRMQADIDTLISHEPDNFTIVTTGSLDSFIIGEQNLDIDLLLSDGTVVKDTSATIVSNFGSLSADSAGGYLKAKLNTSIQAQNAQLRILYNSPNTPSVGFSAYSTHFDILPAEGSFDLRKVGEDYNQQQIYKDLIYQNILEDKTSFFDDFLGQIVGNNKSIPDTLGIKINEKIRNFVGNTADPSTSNLKALTSMLKELKFEYEEYNQEFPPSLTRLIDIFTVGVSKQLGAINQFNQNFNDKGFTDKTTYGKNKGDKLDINKAILNTGDLSKNIIAYEKFSEEYTVLNTNVVSATNVTYISSNAFALSTYNDTWGWGLVIPTTVKGPDISDYYIFYDSIPTIEGSYVEKFIDFDNKLNTYLVNLTSYNDYSRENGVIEKILNHNIYSNLGLLSS